MKRYLILILFGISLLLCGCPEKKSPVEPDPCESAKPISAAFNIYELLEPPDGWEPYDTDTSFASDHYFEAIGYAEEYEWHIGEEIIYQKSVTRRNFPRGKNIPIMLIARGEPNKECFPDDDGIDTVIRYLYVARVMENDEPCTYEFDLFSGNYFGYNTDSPKDTFTITIDACHKYYLGWNIFRLINIPLGCEVEFRSTTKSVAGYRQWRFIHEAGDYDCLTPRGLARIFGKSNDSIRIKYEIQKAPGYQYYYEERIKKEFIGVRVK